MNDGGAQRMLGFQHHSGRWLQRTVLALTAGAIAVIAFFFIAIALIAGALLVGAIAIRWWWLARRLHAARDAAAPIEGEYRVIESSNTSGAKPPIARV